MHYIGVDLGSTNIKVAIYTNDMQLVDRQSIPVEYIREKGFVEFNADTYFEGLTALIRSMVEKSQIHDVSQIILTGQAESLVVVDKNGNALMNAISWMSGASRNAARWKHNLRLPRSKPSQVRWQYFPPGPPPRFCG